ncbi:NrfD/PsrC family molybdoenzyme membrane anchor subunit [Cytobacillus dafuensis]|uniref:Oxidoreductase n=1 Tax=Cytobacillus dafuensis TaxID=1742359 RepID=A0A5B8Z350_CYTDA|nr:NrfD/PsrC family molybdoenzyme membrane anchor subunit [Cytobacillus dafuensis]QED46029.1 oxidoreductase [Cytobacillus dafuensis]
MNETIILDIQHQIPFGMVIVFYIFIAGMSAGLYFFSTLGPVFGIKKMEPLAKPASVMALAAVIPGVLALIVDLGQPLRFYTLLFRFNPSSAMSWGTYILTIFSILTLFYIFFLWKKDSKKAKYFGIAGLVFAIALGLYTGFLIALAPAHPLWNSAIIPVLFLVSGLISGLSIISVCAVFFPKLTGLSDKNSEEVMHHLKTWFILLELTLLGAHLLTLFVSDSGKAVFTHLATGDRMVSFLVIQIAIGMVLPLILLLISNSKIIMGISSFLSLIGVFFLRLNIIIGGQELPKTGSMMNIPENGTHAMILSSIFIVLAVLLILFLPKIVDIVLNRFITPKQYGNKSKPHAG